MPALHWMVQFLVKVRQRIDKGPTKKPQASRHWYEKRRQALSCLMMPFEIAGILK